MSLTFLQRRPSRAFLVLITVAAWSSVALAWTAQHRFDMQPCPWCILQRILFLLIGALALAASVAPAAARALTDRLAGLLILLAALGGAAAAAYQNLYAAKSASCALSLADRIISGLGLDRLWPDMFEVRASCAEAAVRLLGLPFELWSLLLFLALGWAGAKLLGRRA